MPRVANSSARAFVTSREPFTGNNTFGRELIDGSYAAFSYGEHWPLYLWFKRAEQWYGNPDKFSRTSSKHAGQLRPRDASIRHLSVIFLRELVNFCDNVALQCSLGAAGLEPRMPSKTTASMIVTPVEPASKRRLLPLGN